ncbi:Uncharacterised protein [Mycobacterium tuberculosis]|nr:Uncharacterised protein [Mycobacterium tuberculosis]CKS51957.1 Uncharacterised protein [Mycobacterium tuberculosis]CKV07911.1 Uncharacterised protein [Mycobacterium tuberculosis]
MTGNFVGASFRLRQRPPDRRAIESSTGDQAVPSWVVIVDAVEAATNGGVSS